MTASERPSPAGFPYPVLFVSSHTGLGGGETSLHEMVRFLDPARWTPHLLCPQEGQFTALWQSAGWPVHIIPWRPATPVFVPAVWARFQAVAPIADLIRRERIALVRPEYHSVPYVAPACRQTGVPWLWMVHGQWARPRSWQRALFREAAHLFADSRWTKAGFLGEPPFMPPERVEVRSLGVDVNRLTPDTDNRERDRVRRLHGIPLEAQVITILGRFQPIKGHLNFLKMAALLAPDYPAARFLIVGDNVLDGASGNRHKEAVRRLVRDNPHLQQAVLFTGFTDNLQGFLRATDVLVTASDFESFGMANVEAMACGIPVVSTNVGGPADTVLDGQTGYLVPPRDPEALAAAVRRLLDDPARRAEMGRAARAHVEERLDVRFYADRFDAVMAEIVGAAGAG